MRVVPKTLLDDDMRGEKFFIELRTAWWNAHFSTDTPKGTNQVRVAIKNSIGMRQYRWEKTQSGL